MMTVLDIVQNALQEIGVPYPTSLITVISGSQQAKTILQAAARHLRSTRIFPQQKKSTTITLVNGQASYKLAADYYAALPNTRWDNDNDRRLIGPVTDAQMTERTIGNIGVTSDYAYRIFGPDLSSTLSGASIMVHPTPTADGGILSYEYITKNMFFAVAPPSQTEVIAADSDYSYFDDDLLIAEFKWRYLRAKKKEYEQERADAIAMLDSAVARFNGSYTGSTTGRTAQARYTVPDGGWTF